MVEKVKSLYTVKRLCGELEISRQTLLNWRKRGLPAIKIGGRVMFEYQEVVEWIKGQQEQ